MTLLVCLGSTPDTWWQGTNELGSRLLRRAEELASDADVAAALATGGVASTLALNEMEPKLGERVWAAVEVAARQLSSERSDDVSQEWADHLAELAEEMELRRTDPERPGRWP